MVSLNGFNAQNVDPTFGFDPLPAGPYSVVIEKSEQRVGAASGFQYVALTLAVIDGECKGRKLFVNLNLGHGKANVKARSEAELSAICRAVGVMTPNDTGELENKPFAIDVSLRRDQQGEMRNNVKKYMPLGEASAQDQGQQAQAGQDTPPWQR